MCFCQREEDIERRHNPCLTKVIFCSFFWGEQIKSGVNVFPLDYMEIIRMWLPRHSHIPNINNALKNGITPGAIFLFWMYHRLVWLLHSSDPHNLHTGAASSSPPLSSSPPTRADARSSFGCWTSHAPGLWTGARQWRSRMSSDTVDVNGKASKKCFNPCMWHIQNIHCITFQKCSVTIKNH